MKMWIFGVAALAAAMCFGATTEDGVTKERRGALGPNDTVVTDVDTTGIVAARTYTKDEIDCRIETNAPVRSVNGRTGRVILGASDVGALPNNRDDLKASANFRNAVWDVQIRGGGIDTNAVDILANSAVVTNALTVATTNRVAALETATNNLSSSVSGLASSVSDLSSSVSGLASSKADRPALPVTSGNLAAITANGNLADSGKKASDFAPAVDGGYLPLTGGTITGDLHVNESLGVGYNLYATYFSTAYITSWGYVVPALYYSRWYYLPNRSEYPKISDNEIAVKGDISATNPTFSNAVLAVGLNIDTNSVAVLNEIAATFGGFPLGAGETATTIGGLLAALAAAAAWLKKNKVQTLKLDDGSVVKTAESGVAKLDDFFTESNSLLTGTIDARLPYPLYSVPSTGLLKDRAINTTSLASVTVPDNFTDLLIRASVTSSLSVTMPEAVATKYGDTFPGEAGEYLITITKTGAAEAYVRTIKLEEVANA